MLEIELKCYDSLKCMGIQLGLCPLHSQVIMQSIVSVQQFQSVPFLLTLLPLPISVASTT